MLAKKVFATIIENIRKFIHQGIIHSDLSKYNILYWNNTLYIIDFPQSVNIKENPNAKDMLKRDVFNVCTYFSKYFVVNDNDIFNDLCNDLDNILIYGI